MKETSFYFFSTVPQVIGAIIALIGAFHIFNTQKSNSELINRSKNIVWLIDKLRQLVDTVKIDEEDRDTKKFLSEFKIAESGLRKKVKTRDINSIIQKLTQVSDTIENINPDKLNYGKFDIEDPFRRQSNKLDVMSAKAKASWEILLSISYYKLNQKKKEQFDHIFISSAILIVVSIALLPMSKYLDVLSSSVLYFTVVLAVMQYLYRVYKYLIID